jgi:hypothetical protein
VLRHNRVAKSTHLFSSSYTSRSRPIILLVPWHSRPVPAIFRRDIWPNTQCGQVSPYLLLLLLYQGKVSLSLCLSKYHTMKMILCLIKHHDMKMYGGGAFIREQAYKHILVLMSTSVLKWLTFFLHSLQLTTCLAVLLWRWHSKWSLQLVVY